MTKNGQSKPVPKGPKGGIKLAKKSKEIGMDIYYMNKGQTRKENIEK